MRITPSKASRDRTPFIGRARESALLAGNLEQGAGLLTLTGPSGIGKTRLAQQVIQQHEDRFPGGAWFCSLATCESVAEVESAVARTLGFPHKGGQRLTRAIADRGRTLLVLDNLDAVATEVKAIFGGWLERAHDLQILATSIVPTGMEEEIRFELGPLEPADAVALYWERANRAWAGRETSASEKELVEELVRRLDRFPLAIELAAARIRVLPPRALLSRFGERFELLRSSTPGRHGSLLEALRLSWELLNESERQLVVRASIFEGGFTYEAAVAVLAEGEGRIDLLERLDGLRSKALLQLEDSQPPRFVLYESVREFAAKELRATGLEADVVERHAKYFLEEGERRALALEEKGAMEALAWLKAERENLAAILRRGEQKKYAEDAARAGLILGSLLSLEGYPPLGIQLLERTIAAARLVGEPRLIGRALGIHAMSIMPQGQADEALAGVEEGLALVRESKDLADEGELLIQAGSILQRRGDLDAAIAYLERSVEVGKRLGEPLIEASGLLQLGACEHARLALDEAERLFERALPILREHGYRRRENVALTWQAGLWRYQGRFREARRALQEALDRGGTVGNERARANSLMALANVDLAAGMLDAAEKFARESLQIQREIGNRRGEGLVLGALGKVALEQGALEEAERSMVESIGLLKECGDRRNHACALPFLAVMEVRAGRPNEARASLDEAKAYFVEVDDAPNLAIAELFEGTLLLAEARRLAPTNSVEAAALVEEAQGLLGSALGSKERQVGNMFQAIRLLEQDLEDWAAGSRELVGELDQERLLVGPEGEWFELKDGERIDLRRRASIRRIFGALAEKRLSSPGKASGLDELFEIGWPETQIDPEAASRRVYLGIWALRKMGLSKVLLNEGGGYLLDPAIPLLRQQGQITP